MHKVNKNENYKLRGTDFQGFGLLLWGQEFGFARATVAYVFGTGWCGWCRSDRSIG